MTEELERKLKELYMKFKEEQNAQKEAENKWNDLRNKKKQLEMNPIIKDYLQVIEEMKALSKIANQQVLNNNQFFDDFIENYFLKNEETNHIYVYMGTFVKSNEIDIVHSASIMQIPENSFTEKGWKEYRNIESCFSESSITVPRKKTKKFEEENSILYVPEGSDKEVFYKIVRRKFFQYVVEFGQEEAVEKIVEKFGTKEQIVKRERSRKYENN